MICTITLNPAIDKSSSVERLYPERKLRCGPLQTEAGGGGVNISKALKELGSNSHAIFPAGGANGRLLKELLNEAGISFSAIPARSATRESFNINEQSTGAQYRFIMPGETIQEVTVQRCLDKLAAIQPAPDYIVASGSLPPGAPANFFASVARIARKQHAKLIVDTSGEPLVQALEEGVFLAKPNHAELHYLTGKNAGNIEDTMKAGLEVLHKYPCENLLISMGAGGAMLLRRDFYLHACAPAARRLSTCGAGDSMVAGATFMLEQGKGWADVLHFGIACGTAATMNPGSHLFKKEDAYGLLKAMHEQHAVQP